MSKNGLYLSEENKGGYGNPNGLYLTEQSTSSNNGAVRIGGSLYSKNWDNSYKGMHVPNGHGSLFNAMDQDARIIAQCEANKLLWIAEANKQKALENGANLNAPIVPPPPVLNNPVPNNPPLTELEKALAEIKALKEANAAKDLKIANMVSKEEVEQLINIEKQNIEVVKDREKEKDDIIQKVTKENAEKDRVIAEKDKDLEHSHQIKEMQTKEIHDLREDKKELKLEKYEWKAKYEAKDESLQKTIEELTIEKAKVSELNQKIGVHNHDGSSSWIQLDQEEIPNLGEGALENQNSD